MTEIQKYLLEEIQEINPYEEIDIDTMLIDLGILDSLTLVYLVSQIEEKYGISVLAEKLNFSQFENILAIEQLIISLK